MAEYDYQALLDVGYNPEYVEALEASGVTPEQIQEAHFQEMEARRQAEEQAAISARAAPMFSDPMGGGRPPGIQEAFGVEPMPSDPQPYVPSLGAPTVGAHGLLPTPAAAEDPTTYLPSPPEMGGPPADMIQGGPVVPMGDVNAAAWEEQTRRAQYDPQEKTIEEIREMAGLKYGDQGQGKGTFMTQPTYRMEGGTARYTGAKPIRERPSEMGAYSPSRQAPPLSASAEWVMANESPAIQALWMERKQKELGVKTAQDQSRIQGARATMLEQEAEEAGLPFEEKLNRQIQRSTAMYEYVQEQVMPDVEKQTNEFMSALAASDQGAKLSAAQRKVIEESKRKEFQMASINRLLSLIMQSMMAQDPSGAARYQAALASSGMYGMGMPGMGMGMTPGAGTLPGGETG